jgi:hypothetical protein
MTQNTLDPKFAEALDYSIILVDGETDSEIGTFGERISNPFSLDVTKFVPASGHLTLDRAYELASQVINWKQAQEGIAEDSRTILVKDYDPRNMSWSSDSEIITVRLIKRAPAKMSADQSKFVQRRSRWDREYISASAPAHVITILSQPMDHEIEFVVWARDSKRADSRALWLERLFIDHSWIFLSEGADRWSFLQRLSDIVLVQNEHVYHQRPLRFFARLREFEAVYEPQIRKFTFSSSFSS